jgi:protein-S-isoprenylcysteine O-methyltransferase Ste14
MTGGRPESRNPIRLLLHVPVPWVFVLSYLVGVGLENLPLLRSRWVAPLSVHVGGAVLFCLGAAFAGRSWAIFRKAGTTRVPGEAATTLVTWGPYGTSRNPMYVGLAIAYLGEAGILGQIWPVAVLPLTLAYVNRMVIPLEEARLREVFGSAYDEYSTRVRRWI